MYRIFRRNHHCLPRCIRMISTLFLVGGLTLNLCVQSYAGSLVNSVLPIVGIQAQDTKAKNVKAQANNLYNLARKEIRAGNVQKGSELLQQVLILDPMHKNAKNELTKLMGTGVMPRTPVVAVTDKASVPTVESMSSTELVDAAKAMMRDGDYAGAEATLERALAKSTNDQERKQIRSFLSAIQKDDQRRQDVMQRQMEYNLSELDSILQKAAIYLENKQYDRAEEMLEQARMIAPQDPRVQAMTNRLYQESGMALQQRTAVQQKAQLQQNRQQGSASEVLFQEGVQLYKQGQVIAAVDKWRQAIHVDPTHQGAHTYLSNTMLEYEQAVEAQQAALRSREVDSRFEQMLDTEIPQYSTQGERVDVKDVYSLLSTLSGLNVVLDEHVEGNVALDARNTTVRQLLNLLQRQYGFVWKREGDTIFVKPGFVTKVFPLTEGQYKTIRSILDDPSVLQDSNRNLRTILYGPTAEFEVPGKQLFLSETSQSLVVTDTLENLRQVEAFLKDMPVITGERSPVETRVYQLDREIARDIYEIIKLVLYEGQGAYDVSDPRRKLFLENNTNSLIVIDYPDKIEQVERILADQRITRQLQEGELEARQFIITDVDDIEDTPEAYARREEYVGAIAEVIEQMLYGKETREQAILQGRMIVPNPERGTIDVVDSKQNLRRVENYLNSVKGETTQDMLIEIYPIQHVDVGTIADALAYLFFDSQQSTRAQFLSQNNIQTIGTGDTGEQAVDPSNMFEETTRNRFNITGGGGGGTDLLQFFSVRFYPDQMTNSIVVFTPDQEVLDLVSRVVNTFDKPPRMVEIEQRIVSVSLTDLRTINFDYMLTNPLLEPISLNPENMEQSVNISNDTFGQPGLNLSLHTFGESRLDFLMSLLESTSSFNLLSAPKMITLPNPLVNPLIFVGQQIPYADDVTFEDQGDDDPTNNRLVVDFQTNFVGVTFGFIPFILNDDHIYLELSTSIPSAGERLPVGITGQAPPGQTIPNIGPLVLNQKFIQTSVRMKNGSTIVLGGLIDESETENQDRVPFLSKIPFLGALFTDREINKTKVTHMIFVTSRIIEPEY